LIFNDFQNYGLLNQTTNELRMISTTKVDNIFLAEMPQDFYTRPTLRWQLSTNKAGKFKADLSYLTSGIEWRATYNAVINKNDFTLNSWVTLNNRSGKVFNNVNLKLIAGDVQTHQNIAGRTMIKAIDVQYLPSPTNGGTPSFEEREFSDFRIYTLDQKVDIDNNQEKQLSLYPLKEVKYIRKYEYNVGGTATDILITFKNSTADGLGVPLPKGNVNFYEVDTKDGTNQFVGVSTIQNTTINQDVKLKIGTAFDIISKTTIVKSSSVNRTSEVDYEISVTNNKSDAIEVEVIKRLQSGNSEILNPSLIFDKKDALTIIFIVKLNPGQERVISFRERTTN